MNFVFYKAKMLSNYVFYNYTNCKTKLIQSNCSLVSNTVYYFTLKVYGYELACIIS